jgi:lipoprotein signal peptidase
MPNKSYRVVLWTLALLGVAADQTSKYGVFSWLAHVEGNQYWVFHAGPNLGFRLAAQYEKLDPDGKEFRPHVNHGALFGLFQKQEALANTGFAVISTAAAVAIAYWSMRKGAARSLWVCTALGLILAGTLGNLYDRVFFGGVRDFLHWWYPEWFNWPVFNVADCCLVCGAGLLLMQAFGRPAAAAKESATNARATAAIAAAEPLVHKKAV